MDEYRQHLVLARQKAQEDYDKTLISLSGGALGISFAFLDRLTNDPPYAGYFLLFSAWGSWLFCLVTMLASFYLSRMALGRAIKEVDNQSVVLRPGGWLSLLTELANVVGGILFFIGLIALGIFVWLNLSVPSSAGGDS
jgi:hypothetical protein